MTTDSFGHYRLCEVIGRGGMGVVYKAHDTRHERDVALKMLPENLASNEEFRARFEREARTTAGLEDPHVVPLHSFGEIDGRLYLDMRLIRGPSLEAILRNEGPLDPPRAISIIEQVASALVAAHNAGLLHRDVKPSNVMVLPAKGSNPEFAYLTDFGISRSVEATTRSALTSDGSTIGTLDYMAPEQFLGHQIDHRVDIYALGCLLYEAVTAKRPFPGDSLAALMYAHLNTPPPTPSHLRPEQTAGLDSVVARAMAKSPDDRFQTANEFATSARDALNVAAPTASNPTSTRSNAATFIPQKSSTATARMALAPIAPAPVTPVSTHRLSPARWSRVGLLSAVGILSAVIIVAGAFWLAGPPSAGGGISPSNSHPEVSSDSTQTGENPSGTAPAPADETPANQVGQETTNGGAAVTVKAVSASTDIELNESSYRAGSGYESYTRTPAGAGAKYVTVAAHVRNDAKKSMDLTCSLPIKTNLVDDKGRQFDTIPGLYKIKGNPECNKLLQPGFELDMAWIYLVPTTAHNVGWTFQDLTEGFGGTHTSLVHVDVPNS
jgi:serine/threonine protein kinase